MDSQRVTYVLVPANDADALQEMQLTVPDKLEDNISCLTTCLQDFFRQHGGAITAAGRDQLLESMRERVQPGAAPDERMMAQVALSQTVDIVQLLPATQASGWFGVNMYVDDKGVSKGAPVNRRASDICTQCGLATEVLGDAFIARVWDDQDGFQRLDLCIRDLASDAAWVTEARERNSVRPDLNEAAARLKSIGGPKPQPREPELQFEQRLGRGEALRADGTARFKAGEHAAAAECYAEALGLFEPAPPLSADEGARADELRLGCLLNLASCWLRLERPFDAIAVCDRAIAVDEASAKAWFRRGQACMKLQQYGAARKNLTRACTLAPSSREIRAEAERCIKLHEASQR